MIRHVRDDDDPRYEPESVETSLDVGIRITWADDHVSTWDLAFIRRSCGCAECNELRRVGKPAYPRPGSPDEIDVVSADLIGAYGISFTWNDGHATGIYRWEDLRDGCACDECRTERRMTGRRNPLDR